MKKYISLNPQFSDYINITEAADPAHADVINTAPIQIFQNTLINKQRLDNMDEAKPDEIDSILDGTFDREESSNITKMGLITKSMLNYFWNVGIVPIKNKLVEKLDVANLANNLLTSVPGYALDAMQGKILDDKIEQINSKILTYTGQIEFRAYASSNIVRYFTIPYSIPNGYKLLGAQVKSEHINTTLFLPMYDGGANNIYVPYYRYNGDNNEICKYTLYFTRI